jgi:serine/threonine protein kinase
MKLSEAQRLQVMSRFKAGDISMDECLQLTLEAERELAREQEEELVCIVRREDKLRLCELDVLLCTKAESKSLKSAVKTAQNRAKTAFANPFKAVTKHSKGSISKQHAVLVKREIPRSTMTAVKHVGNGQFGDVYMANFRVQEAAAQKQRLLRNSSNTSTASFDGDVEVQVAVKTLKPSSKADDEKQFVDEMILQAALDHENIVGIVGVSMMAKPYLCALEFAMYGDLLGVLQACKGKHIPLNEWEQSYLLTQLADALAYLKKNRIAHIDLATRNCLIFGETKLKLADFGLARRYTPRFECWKMTGSLMLPFRQMPPETLSSVLWDRTSKEPFNPEFNETTDIWAYGTVMWELATCVLMLLLLCWPSVIHGVLMMGVHARVFGSYHLFVVCRMGLDFGATDRTSLSLLFARPPSYQRPPFFLHGTTRYGRNPFAEIKKGLPEVMKQVRGGLRLKFPDSFSKRLLGLAQQCFSLKATDRPTFQEVGKELTDALHGARFSLCVPELIRLEVAHLSLAGWLEAQHACNMAMPIGCP